MATVLKPDHQSEATTAARKISGLAGFNLNDLADQGKAQLRACREEVDRMLAAARVEAETIRSQAEQAGYAEGLRKAAETSAREIKTQAAAVAKNQSAVLHRAVAELHTQYQTWMQQYAQVLNVTAMSVARRVACSELTQRRELLLQWTAEALRSTRAATRLTVAVHPETLAELGRQLDELVASNDLPEQTIVTADDSLGPHDVVVRQTGGEIQAGLDAQLERLRELLG